MMAHRRQHPPDVNPAMVCSSLAGLLALRTVAISGTFALATSLAARSDLAHAAAHQICLQLWLASSLLADSLAVAAQTLMAQGVAAKELQQTRKVQAALAVSPLKPAHCVLLCLLIHPDGPSAYLSSYAALGGRLKAFITVRIVICRCSL